jgi:hypothetical protein
MANVIDPDLIGLCVEFAVDACQVSGLSYFKAFADFSPGCKNTKPESSHTSRSCHCLSLLLLWRYLAAMLGDKTDSFNTKARSPGN